jgi:hypothetical protein
MKLATIALSLIALAACQNATGPAGPPDTSQSQIDTLVLAPGQEVGVDRLFRVGFMEVSSDSRCPTDVLCIWAGNAAVEIALAIGEGPSYPFTLNTFTYPPATVDFSGYRVTLLDLTPHPVSTTPIQPGDYRAHLQVGRADSTASR